MSATRIKRPSSVLDEEPATVAQTSPMGISAPDHSLFTLQAVVQMQATLGKLEQAVVTLTTTDQETRARVARIERAVIGASAVFVVAVIVLGWMLNAAKDFALEYYKESVTAAAHGKAQPATNEQAPATKTGRMH